MIRLRLVCTIIIMTVIVTVTGCNDNNVDEVVTPTSTIITTSEPIQTQELIETYTIEELFGMSEFGRRVSEKIGAVEGIELKQLETITDMSTSKYAVNSLNGISNLMNLEKLSIGLGDDLEMSSNIFEELTSLSNLNYLEIEYQGHQEEYKIVKDIYKVVEYNSNIETLKIEYWAEMDKDDEIMYVDIDLSKLSELDNVKEIELLLSSPEVSVDVGRLAELDNLQSLKIRSYYLQYVENIEKIVNLKLLDIHAADIKSLHGIGQLVNLEYLNFYGNPNLSIGQFKHLHNLINLSSLSIGDTEMDIDIQFLNSMPKLEYLELFSKKIINTSALENTKSLSKLRLVIANNEDMAMCIEMLSDHNNLTDVNLHCKEDMRKEDLLPLLDIENLSIIDLSNVKMSEASKIEIVEILEENGVEVIK